MFDFLFFLPNWIRNLLPAQPRFEPEYGVFDAAGPAPDARIDFLGRIPLTRPSSPNQISECSSDSASTSEIGTECELQPQPFLEVMPPEIRYQIWKDVLGGFSFHLKLERRRLRGWVCMSQDPSTCNSDKTLRCGPSERQYMISLLLICRQV